MTWPVTSVPTTALPSLRAPSVGGLRLHALLLWILSGVLLVAPLDIASVERTQEGRVLETAREMLEAGAWRDWIVPRLGGELRIKKPPLAYWLAAGSFSLFGVNEWSGRLPFAIAGWLTTGLLYHMGSRLFGARVGFLSAAVLTGCFMFARYGRLAETDVLVMLFVTAAVYATWRGLEPRLWTRSTKSMRRSSPFWFHVGAAAIGLTALSKGLPALYPLVFLLALVAWQPAWPRLWAWFACGAPLTALAVAAPWFLYILLSVDASTMLNEIRVVTTGDGHRNSFANYFAFLPMALAPWTGFTVLALWLATRRRWRRDPRLSGVLVWTIVILLSLCVAGQKQKHYLLPLMPPLALITGWAMARLGQAQTDSSLYRSGDAVMVATIVACGAFATVPIVAGRIERGSFEAIDLAAAMTLALLAVSVWIARRRAGLPCAAHVLAIASVVGMTVLIGIWAPSIEPHTTRDVAVEINRSFGDRPMCYYKAGNLCLAFAARRQIPAASDDEELLKLVQAQPDTLLLVEDRAARPPTAVPARFALRSSIPARDKIMRVYAYEPPGSLDPSQAVP